MRKFPFVVIGAGAAGLVVAMGLARAKKRVLLIEKGAFGGDCTNLGCIPSKSLIAAAEVIHATHVLGKMDITAKAYINCEDALKYVHRVVDAVRKKEEPNVLKKEGAQTLSGAARFIDNKTLVVETAEGCQIKVQAKKIIIATGSKPRIPDVVGLNKVPFLTNENIFELKSVPKRLAIVGAGAIGCELAQAFRRLGAEVDLIHPHTRVLDKEEPIAAKLISEIFQKEGIKMHLETDFQEVHYEKGVYTLLLSRGKVEADALLIATGREARVCGLDLAKGGIEVGPRGILTDSYGKTSNRKVFAIGDVASSLMFTHTAEASGRALVFNLLMPWPFKRKVVSTNANPHVTFTSPEIASIGMTQKEAEEKYGKKKIKTYFVPLDKVDRAICQDMTEGFVFIVTKKWSSRMLGATIASSRGGEMLMEIGMAMTFNVPLRKISNLLHPYPIYNLAIRKAADQWLSNILLRKKKK